jgi:hypothetical protein
MCNLYCKHFCTTRRTRHEQAMSQVRAEGNQLGRDKKREGILLQWRSSRRPIVRSSESPWRQTKRNCAVASRLTFRSVMTVAAGRNMDHVQSVGWKPWRERSLRGAVCVFVRVFVWILLWVSKEVCLEVNMDESKYMNFAHKQYGCLSASFCVVLSFAGRGLTSGWSPSKEPKQMSRRIHNYRSVSE